MSKSKAPMKARRGRPETSDRSQTDRRAAHEALKESERRYKSLFENMAEGLMYCRMLFEDGQPRDWIYLEVNPAVERLNGLPNVVGRKVSEVLPGAREANPELLERYGRVAMTGQPERFEYFSVRLKRWFSVSTYCPKKEHFISVFHNITARKQAEEALKNSEHQLRALLARLQSVREEESIRIAREIHDDLGQTLTRLKMDMLWMERKFSKMPASPDINSLLNRVVEATELVDSATRTVQQIAADLRPVMLDAPGLGAALPYEARRFEQRTGIRCVVRLPEKEPVLSNECATALLRIFQESLTNVARHAGAGKAEVELRVEGGSLILTVRDDGRGITEAEIARPESLGLLGMKERAELLGGEIIFRRHPNRPGTVVTVRIPQKGGVAT